MPSPCSTTSLLFMEFSYKQTLLEEQDVLHTWKIVPLHWNNKCWLLLVVDGSGGKKKFFQASGQTSCVCSPLNTCSSVSCSAHRPGIVMRLCKWCFKIICSDQETFQKHNHLNEKNLVVVHHARSAVLQTILIQFNEIWQFINTGYAEVMHCAKLQRLPMFSAALNSLSVVIMQNVYVWPTLS